MARSKKSKFRKMLSKQIWSTKDFAQWEKELLYPDGDMPDRVDARSMPAPPYKVGKQFPYENARVKRENGVLDNLDQFGGDVWRALESLTKPHPKTDEQLQIESSYMGRTRQFPKPARHKHGGDGTVRRSSQRKAYRGDQGPNHSVVPILVEA